MVDIAQVRMSTGQRLLREGCTLEDKIELLFLRVRQIGVDSEGVFLQEIDSQLHDFESFSGLDDFHFLFFAMYDDVIAKCNENGVLV